MSKGCMWFWFICLRIRHWKRRKAGTAIDATTKKRTNYSTKIGNQSINNILGRWLLLLRKVIGAWTATMPLAIITYYDDDDGNALLRQLWIRDVQFVFFFDSITSFSWQQQYVILIWWLKEGPPSRHFFFVLLFRDRPSPFIHYQYVVKIMMLRNKTSANFDNIFTFT